ncbi:MAG: MFS transporter [Myxococcota bacterium]
MKRSTASASPPPTFSPLHVRCIVGLLGLTSVLCMADRMLMSILLEDIQAEIGLTDRDFGLLLGFGFAGTHLLAAFPIARWADRWSRRNIIALGLAVWSAMTLLTGAAQSFGQLLVCRLGLGLGEAANTPAGNSLISDLVAPARRARALAVMTIGGIAGLGLGMLMGGWLNLLVGWRATFMLFGLPGLGLALLARTFLVDPPRGHSDGLTGAATRHSMGEVFRYMSRRASYRWLVAAACIAGITSFGNSFWIPTFLRRAYGMDSASAGTGYFLASAVPTAIGAYVGGWAGDRLAQRTARWYLWLPAISNLAVPPLMLAFLWVPADAQVLGRPVGFALLFVASGVGVLWSAPTMALSQSLVRPSMRAMSAATWNGLFTFVGMGLGPWLIGDLSVRLEPTRGAESLRLALTAMTLLPPAASLCLLLAARSVEADLRSAGEPHVR